MQELTVVALGDGFAIVLRSLICALPVQNGIGMTVFEHSFPACLSKDNEHLPSEPLGRLGHRND
jgi:hypothetical protein